MPSKVKEGAPSASACTQASRYLCTFYDAFIDQDRGGISLCMKYYTGGSLQVTHHNI